MFGNELKKQQSLLKKDILKIENNKDTCNDWIDLKAISNENHASQGIISQNKVKSVYYDQKELMANNGIKINYKQSDLRNDILTGFNGSNEYDNNIIATQLVINASKVNDQFQRDCKLLFNQIKESLQFNDKSMLFASAPIKTRNRITMKAATDYALKSWPHTVHVIDVIRCSITFETPKQLLQAYTMFKQKIPNNANYGSPFGCLKIRLRAKNGFSDLPKINIDDDNNDTMNDQIGYRDLKINVLVEHGNITLVGDTIFIVNNA